MKKVKEMTVSEYAAHIGKSIPRIYQLIEAGKLTHEKKFGRYIIIVR